MWNTAVMGDSEILFTYFAAMGLHYSTLNMWDLSLQPGIKPTSPALEGRFLTNGPPEKPLSWGFLKWTYLNVL